MRRAWSPSRPLWELLPQHRWPLFITDPDVSSSSSDSDVEGGVNDAQLHAEFQQAARHWQRYHGDVHLSQARLPSLAEVASTRRARRARLAAERAERGGRAGVRTRPSFDFDFETARACAHPAPPSATAARAAPASTLSSARAAPSLFDLDPGAAAVVVDSVSTQWSARVDAVGARFQQFVLERGLRCSVADAPPSVLINFLFANYVSRNVGISSAASALSTARAQAGGRSLANDFHWRRFLRGARELAPPGRRVSGALPFAPSALTPYFPLDSSFRSRRLRALLLLRIVALLRPGEPASIVRSSVQRFQDAIGRSVVIFRYSSKNSKNFQYPTDGNYVEFLSLDATDGDEALRAALCPATNLLALRALVDSLPDAQAHDQVFTTQSGRALRVDTVRSLVNSFLSSVPDSVVDERWKSHSLRSMSQSALQLCGVPRDHINIRGGWTSRLESATVARHYVHFRLVPGNFADLLLFSRD